MNVSFEVSEQGHDFPHPHSPSDVVFDFPHPHSPSDVVFHLPHPHSPSDVVFHLPHPHSPSEVPYKNAKTLNTMASSGTNEVQAKKSVEFNDADVQHVVFPSSPYSDSTSVGPPMTDFTSLSTCGSFAGSSRTCQDDGFAESEFSRSQTSRSLRSVWMDLLKKERWTHGHVMWLVVLTIGAVVGLINFLMVFVGHKLHDWKRRAITESIDAAGLVGALVIPAITVLLCLIASVMVCYGAPMVAGSGLPEIKGYLNGSDIPGLFQTRKHWIRIAGIMLTVLAGMPLGREGPMVCIGGSLGILVVQQILKRNFFHPVSVQCSMDPLQQRRFSILQEEDYGRHKRIGCTLGAACGVASAFHAPLGGVLYMMEEVAGVFKWTKQVTFQAFVGTATAVLISSLLLLATSNAPHRLVLFARPGHEVWIPIDLVFSVLLGALCGYMSAVFTILKIKIFKLRKSWAWRKNRQLCILEVCIVALIVGLTWAYAPLVLPCVDKPSDVPMPQASVASHKRILSKSADFRRSLSDTEEAHHDEPRKFFSYGCYNSDASETFAELATYWWSGAEHGVLHLYARGDDSEVRIWVALLALLIYMPLAMSMAGLSIPSGMFIPTMFMGACLGRSVGELLKSGGLTTTDPGVYAFIGSGAMLGGFTHMTIAVVALMVEVSGDLDTLVPLSVAVAVGRFVSQMINHHPYDEELVILKKVPLLEADLPACFASGYLETKYVTRPISKQAILHPLIESIEVIRVLMHEPTMAYFPVCDDNDRFIGICSRGRLEEVVSHVRGNSTTAFCESDEFEIGVAPLENPAFSARRKSANLFVQPLGHRTVVPVETLMDPSPFCIRKDSPVSNLYNVLVNCDLPCVCVLASSGEVYGLVTRADLHNTIMKVTHGCFDELDI